MFVHLLILELVFEILDVFALHSQKKIVFD